MNLNLNQIILIAALLYTQIILYEGNITWILSINMNLGPHIWILQFLSLGVHLWDSENGKCSCVFSISVLVLDYYKNNNFWILNFICLLGFMNKHFLS